MNTTLATLVILSFHLMSLIGIAVHGEPFSRPTLKYLVDLASGHHTTLNFLLQLLLLPELLFGLLLSLFLILNFEYPEQFLDHFSS